MRYSWRQYRAIAFGPGGSVDPGGAGGGWRAAEGTTGIGHKASVKMARKMGERYKGTQNGDLGRHGVEEARGGSRPDRARGEKTSQILSICAGFN